MLLYRTLGLLLAIKVAAASKATNEPRQINPVSALLPWTNPDLNGHRVNLTLQAFGGCYRWRVQRPNLIKIRDLRDEEVEDFNRLADTPLQRRQHAELIPREVVGGKPQECHSAVMVGQFLSDGVLETRERSWVFAEDLLTGNGVKCEVYVAPIQRIEIETTARSVAVGGVEALRIRAFDAEDNVFSSLEGLRFEWEIERPKYLGLASFNNDIYRPSHTRRAIHQNGEQSDEILLKGLESGRSIVRARLKEPGYKHVEIAKVELDVAEPIVAAPSTIAVPPLAAVNFGVRVLKGKELPSQAPLVTVPHANFRFSSQNKFITVDAMEGRGRIMADSVVGEPTGVIVSDKRNHKNVDMSTVTIKSPKSLRMLQVPVGDFFGDCSVRENIEALKALAAHVSKLQHTPVSLSPASPESAVWKIRALGGEPKPLWHLPRNQYSIVVADLIGSDGESLYIPENARVTLSGVEEEGQKMEIESLGEGMSMWLVKAPADGSGVLEVKLETISGNETQNTIYNVMGQERYIVVDPVSIRDQAPMICSKTKSTNPMKLAASRPIVLPPKLSAAFELAGGSGSYRVDSADPRVCTASLRDNTLTLSTADEGIAVVTVYDEMMPTNFYRIHCVVGHLEKLYHHIPLGRQLPIVGGSAYVDIPILGEAHVDDTLRSNPPPTWDPVTRDLLTFTACQNISSSASRSNEEKMDVNARTGVRHEAKGLNVRTADPTSREMCFMAQVETPRDVLSTVLTTTVMDPARQIPIAVSTPVEFFSPLKVRVRDQDMWRGLNLQSPLAHQAVTIESSRLDESIAVAVGSTVNVDVVGGPSREVKCGQNVEVNVTPEGTLSVKRITGAMHDDHVRVVDDGSFSLRCLDVVGAAEVTFSLKTNCPNTASSTLETKLLVGCSIPRTVALVPDDRGSSQQVELSAPAPKQRQQGKRFVSSTGSVLSGKLLQAHPDIALNADGTLHVVCDQQHRFRVVAFDEYGRPLLSSASFSPAVALYDRDGRLTLKKTGSVETPEITSTSKCFGEGTLAAALGWDGDFANSAYSDLRRNETHRLKEVSRKVNDVITRSKLWLSPPSLSTKLLSTSLNLPLSRHPLFFGDHVWTNTPLLENSEWVYRIVHAYTSGKARFFVSSAEADTNSTIPTPPRIVSQSFDQRALHSLGRTSHPDLWEAQKTIDVVDWPQLTLGSEVVGSDELMIQPTGPGTYTLTAVDPGILGARPVTLSLDFARLSELQIQLHEDTGAIRADRGHMNEIETLAPYTVNVVASDTRGRNVPSSLLKSLHMQWDVHPAHGGVVTGREGNHLFTAKHTGRTTLAGTADLGGRLIASAPLDLLVHEPLSVQPRDLLLLPGRHTWEMKVTGGPTKVKGFSLKSTDGTVASVRSQGNKHVVTTAGVGRAILTLADNDSGEVYDRSQGKVTVAYPHKAGVLLKGQRFTNDNRGQPTDLPIGVPMRLHAALLDAGNQEFTAPDIASSAGFEQDANPNFQCFYEWRSDKPEIVSVLNERRLAVTGYEDISSIADISVLPESSGRVRSNTATAVFALPLSPGSGKLTLTVECSDNQKWGAQLRRWSDIVDIPVHVTDDTHTGIPEITAVADVDPYFGLHVLTVKESDTHKTFKMDSSVDTGSARTHIGQHCGQSAITLGNSVVLLPDSIYTLSLKNWAPAWTFSLLCNIDSIDPAVKHPGALSQICSQSSSPIKDATRIGSDLILHTSSTVSSNTEGFLSIRGSGNAQTFATALKNGVPKQMYLRPLNGQVQRPIHSKVGENKRFEVILRDNHGKRFLLPADLP